MGGKGLLTAAVLCVTGLASFGGETEPPPIPPGYANELAVLAALATRAVHAAPAGVRGVAEVLDPVETLRAAAERGVRGLVYEGID